MIASMHASDQGFLGRYPAWLPRRNWVDRQPSGSLASELGYRVAITAALARLARSRTGPTRRLRSALRRVAANRFTDPERVALDEIERQRRSLRASGATRRLDELGVVDFAGAVDVMSIPPVLGRLLFALVRELRPARCLELGTAFGISGAYQGAALKLNGQGSLVTADVNAKWAAIARELFAALELDNVTSIVGDPERVLEAAVAGLDRIDLAFVDSDHSAETTIASFRRLEPLLAPGGVLVFDDVRFDAAMRSAWTSVAKDPAVAAAIPLARLGLAVHAGTSARPARTRTRDGSGRAP